MSLRVVDKTKNQPCFLTSASLLNALPVTQSCWKDERNSSLIRKPSRHFPGENKMDAEVLSHCCCKGWFGYFSPYVPNFLLDQRTCPLPSTCPQPPTQPDLEKMTVASMEFSHNGTTGKKKKKGIGFNLLFWNRSLFHICDTVSLLELCKKKISPMSGLNEVIICYVKTEAIVCKGAAGKAIS